MIFVLTQLRSEPNVQGVLLIQGMQCVQGSVFLLIDYLIRSPPALFSATNINESRVVADKVLL